MLREKERKRERENGERSSPVSLAVEFVDDVEDDVIAR